MKTILVVLALATITPTVRAANGVTPEHRPHVHGDDRSTQVVIPREQTPEAIRQAQHPLPNLHIRQHVVDRVRRALGHPTPTAGQTKAAPFARERHQAVMATRIAVKARESGGEAAAGQELAKLARHEARQAFAVAERGHPRAERLEVVADEAVEHGVRSILGPIRDGSGRHAPPHTRHRASRSRVESGGNRGTAVFAIAVSATTSGQDDLESCDRFVAPPESNRRAPSSSDGRLRRDAAALIIETDARQRLEGQGCNE